MNFIDGDQNVKEVELDEMRHFIRSKKTKMDHQKGVDRCIRRTIAWAVGDRNVATFK
ncbi:MAG: hypothetical protein P0S93_06345 [Candidatus Neptunochlamydia sp.]|nr:hypothetical protein [Candidatus Neptunochlamydia sp.]